MNQTIKDIYLELSTKYNKSTLTKSELAQELNISVSTINYYLSRGINLPNYKKLSGKAKFGRVLFPLLEIAIFLSQTTKVA